MLTTMNLGRRTLILGYARRQRWLGPHIVRTAGYYRSVLFARLGGFYAVLTTPAVELMPRYPDPEQTRA